MRHTHDPARHADEQRLIEDHRQTAHKLALYRAYVGAWGNILAQAKLPKGPPKHLFLVDTHCGAGLHGSREHPDGGVIGSPLIAANEARRLQRRYPGLAVHVRAADNDPRWIAHLRQRIVHFQVCLDPRDRVDIQTYPEPFEKKLPEFLREVKSYDAPSLWFIDPNGIKVPYDTVHLLEGPSFGPEIIINLDMLGMWRVDAAARDREDERFEMTILGDPYAQNCLNDLFGGREFWDPPVGGDREPIVDRTQTLRDNVPRLAAAYVERFPRFQFGNHYPLLATHGQMREIVHLTHAQVARDKFYAAYVQSQNFGLLSTQLDHMTRAHAARRYWLSYRAEETSIDHLYQEGTQPFDRGQIRAICNTADEERYGRYDERAALIRWFDERGEDPADQVYQPTLF
jgi:three-Cys-motif partner protein